MSAFLIIFIAFFIVLIGFVFYKLYDMPFKLVDKTIFAAVSESPSWVSARL